MGVNKQLPRLTREDVRDLRRAAQQLDAAAVVLVKSTWQGSVPVLTMLDQVKQVIAGLYNRAEPAYMRSSEGNPSEMPPDASGKADDGQTSSGEPDDGQQKAVA